ncbi:MAG: glycosyltransferase family 92 protein [Selenomonadaceae bacterium]|nr:glycosyltransferase family 92 protein [Selenomonadaceae bacterium]
MVDKNLFLYDLGVVAIMKDEDPYVKEWLEYHLLAGVDHFYIYDNDSTPEFKKILQSYIDAGIVTYTFLPGLTKQYEAYNDSFQRFKFECRYIAWIDADEFILPKSKPTITEVADEILSLIPNAAALGVNWLMFGANGHEKADYSRGVLDRFTACDEEINRHIKTIINPRKIYYFQNPHFAFYFPGCYSVNEEKTAFLGPFNDSKTADKIRINHYYTKSREEYEKKVQRGRSDINLKRNMDSFTILNHNETFDNDIIKYRDARIAALIPDGNIAKLFPAKQINYQRLFNALNKNLMPTLTKGTPQEFFADKMETFLTCFNLIAAIKDKVFDETTAKFFEELSLKAIHRALLSPLQAADIFLLINEMPKILELDYPAVKNIRDVLLNLISQLMTTLRAQARWQEFTELEYKFKLLKIFPKS